MLKKDISHVNINGVKYGIDDSSPNPVFVEAYSDMPEEDYRKLVTAHEAGFQIIGVMHDEGYTHLSNRVFYSQGYGFEFHFESFSSDRMASFVIRLKPSGEWNYHEYFDQVGDIYRVSTDDGFTYRELDANKCKTVLLYKSNSQDFTGEMPFKGTRIWTLTWFGHEKGNFPANFAAIFCSCGSSMVFSSQSPDDIMYET